MLFFIFCVSQYVKGLHLCFDVRHTEQIKWNCSCMHDKSTNERRTPHRLIAVACIFSVYCLVCGEFSALFFSAFIHSRFGFLSSSSVSVKRNYTTERDWEKCSDNFQFLLTRLNFIVQRQCVCVCAFVALKNTWLQWFYDAFIDFLLAFASYPSYVRIALKIPMNFRKHFAETVNFISFPFAMIHFPTEVYYAQVTLSFNFLFEKFSIYNKLERRSIIK